MDIYYKWDRLIQIPNSDIIVIIYTLKKILGTIGI